jgi:N-acyl-D-amino-acid deacylase
MLRLATLSVLTAILSTAQPAPPAPPRVTGPASPRLAPFDNLMLSLLRKYHVEGGALAVARNGRLVLAHGYGLADRESGEAVEPESLFRVASISKPFTSVAILKLVEQGKLSLDTRAIPLLDLGAPTDPRLNRITVRQLLLHAGGWDRGKSFDPMFIPIRAANAVGARAPASCETVIRYMLTRPLDFDPGTRSAYSNFGYCILGRVIEKVTGQSYEEYVRTAVMAPLGITRMRIGHSLLEQRAPGEVKYYDVAGAAPVRSVFPGHAPVPRPYGGFYLEAMDSHGGWIASVIDLVRFLVHIDGTVGPSPLQPATVARMIARPEAALAPQRDTWYAYGWQVRRAGKDGNWWHTGSLDGTITLMVRTFEGNCWAALFNGSPKQQDRFIQELDEGLWTAASQVKQWPANRDLFERFR